MGETKSKINIQCPECGGILKREYSGLWKCPNPNCSKGIFSEEEIRERCGI